VTPHAVLIVLAAVLWGTTGTAQALAPADAQPMVVGALRLLVGGAALLAWALASGGLRGVPVWPVLPLAAAGASMAIYQVCFFTAMLKTGVAAGTLVAIGSAPVFAGLLAFLIRGERPGRRWLLATALAVGGCALLMTVDAAGVRISPAGILLALGAGAAYANYAVVSKGILEHLDPAAAMAVVFVTGALLLVPVLLFYDLAWLAAPRGLTAALYLGVVATALSYILYARGLKGTPVAHAVTLTLAEPLTAGLLGIAVLGERLSGQSALGMALILAGLAVVAVTSGSISRHSAKNAKGLSNNEESSGIDSGGVGR